MTLLEQEVPLVPPFPTLPNWSENFCLAGFDPRQGIGIWLHIGRWRRDLSLWRETIVVTWPDGTVSAYRAFGNARDSAHGPGGANFAIRLLDHGQGSARRFHYSYLGGAQRVVAEDLRAGLQVDGPRHRLEIELIFTSTAEIWDLHEVGSRQDFIGTGHIEQIGLVRGTIGFDGHRSDFEAYCNRDHSMGPRDTATLGAHHWLQAYFDSGISVLTYDAVLRGQTQPVVSEAVVYEQDRKYKARLTRLDRIEAVADATRRVGFEVTYVNGPLQIMMTEVANTAYLSFTRPNDHYIGVFQGGVPPLTLLEQAVRFRLSDGTEGAGWMERSVPGVVGAD